MLDGERGVVPRVQPTRHRGPRHDLVDHRVVGLGPAVDRAEHGGVCGGVRPDGRFGVDCGLPLLGDLHGLAQGEVAAGRPAVRPQHLGRRAQRGHVRAKPFDRLLHRPLAQLRPGCPGRRRAQCGAEPVELVAGLADDPQQRAVRPGGADVHDDGRQRLRGRLPDHLVGRVQRVLDRGEVGVQAVPVPAEDVGVLVGQLLELGERLLPGRGVLHVRHGVGRVDVGQRRLDRRLLVLAVGPQQLARAPAGGRVDDHRDAAGFIKLNALRLRLLGRRDRA